MIVTQCSCWIGKLLNIRKTRIIKTMHDMLIQLSLVAYEKGFDYRCHIFSTGPLPHSMHRMYRQSMSSDQI